MKGIQLFSICLLASASLASGTTFSPGAVAYGAIPTRNVFGLKPTQQPQPRPVDLSLLPAVKMTGLTTILGDERVLLKLTFPAQPPEPAREVLCMLVEGQSFGPIELLEIDLPAERAKLSNTGQISWVTFEKPAVRMASPR